MTRYALPLALCALLLSGAAVRAEELAGVMAARGSIEVAFAPEGDPEAALVRLVASAQRSVRVQAYLFTSKTLARALLDAHRRGLTVELLADAEKTDEGVHSQVPLLAAAGIPVALETRYAAAHNKIVLVDAETPDGAVATGSFNFTYSARAKNAENLIILRGNRELVRAYFDNWRRHRADAVPYGDERERVGRP